MSASIRLFTDLDRLGPGNAESLRWALGVAGIGRDGRILDAGCGTGADLGTLVAAVPDGSVTAIDQHEAFVEVARTRSSKLRAQVGDFLNPPDGPYDLIWSAGAVSAMGVQTALSAWRAFVSPGGRVAFSDLRWRGEGRPDEVRRFFAQEQSGGMRDVAELEAEIAEAGYRLIEARWLGAPGWASYYGPLEVALDDFDEDPDLVAHLRAEIALWRTHGVDYGFRIVVCAPE